jgi:PAS domain S-box-containing protein
MSASGSQLCYLRDARLAPLATSALPAWLWSMDATQILWANAIGALMFGAPTPTALRAHRFDAGEPVAVQIGQIAATLSAAASPRLERLRGLGGGTGRALTCACSRIELSDDTAGILVAAFERAGPDLPLSERVARLLAGGAEPIAAFADDGRLMAATENAHAHLNGAVSLAACEAQALAEAALASGRAAGRSTGRPISLERIGSGAATVLIASFDPPVSTSGGSAIAGASPATATAANGLPPRPMAPQLPGVRRHPLRFVWQMDEEGRFTFGNSDEFLALVGPRTAAAIGRPWVEMAAALGLDPGGEVARAIATRDTWSGLSVSWPLDAARERLTVVLSGLPVFDRNRIFRGYRGFGVCRDGARRAAAAGQTNPAPSAAAAPPAAENIVRFPGAAAEPSAPTLSPVERSAFRELSRKLAQRLSAASVPFADTGKVPSGRHEAVATVPPALEAADEDTPALATVVSAGDAAQLELVQAELAELRSALDTASDGVMLVDPQGTVVSANQGAERLFGYGANALAGRALAELLAPESVDAVYACLHSLADQGGARQPRDGREVVGCSRQGSPLQLFMSAGLIAGSPDKFCLAFRDISGWKTAEEELTRAKRQAEKASSAKSDFLARISHEIRTPLNAIIGFSEVMMEERFGPVGNERYREYLKDIHASGGHLLSLINDLLDLSKIEAGKLELTFASVSLNDLTQQCVAIMQPQANRERVIIRTSLPPALPQVVADARSVRQIVLNLLSNSIKFTGAGGQVIVSTAFNDNGEVALRVRDTGIGMSEKELVAALEPFRQLATSVHSGSGGTGLGLPLTKALAEANHASFYIKSAPKAGTLVEIAFPTSRVLAG